MIRLSNKEGTVSDSPQETNSKTGVKKMSPEIMIPELTTLELQEKLREIVENQNKEQDYTRSNYFLKQYIIEELMLRSWAKVLGKKVL